MATETGTATKILVFDGDCPMCRSTVGMLIRSKLVSAEQTKPNYEFEGADLEAIQAAGIRNQLVVMEPVSRETRVGTDGLLWIIRDNTGNHVLVRLLDLPGIRQLLRWGYQTISYNRRVISPPRHQIKCDCEPEVTVARRLSLIVPAVAIAVVLLGLFGLSILHNWDAVEPSTRALVAILGGAGGFAAVALAAITLLRGEKRIDYLGHLAMTLLAGTLVLIPAMLIGPFVGREAAIAIGALSAAASCALMAAMQRRRVKAVGLPAVWLWAWILAIGISVGVTLYLAALA